MTGYGRQRVTGKIDPAALANYGSQVLADTPIGYWPLDEPSGTTATDYANGRSMTYRNSPILGVSAPGGLKGITVNGSTQLADTAGDSVFTRAAQSAWTVEAVFKSTDSGTTLRTILAWRGTAGEAADEVCALFLNHNAVGRVEINCPSPIIVSHDGGWNDGNWHHVVATAGLFLRLYIDGVERSTASTTPRGTGTGADRIQVGASRNGGSNFLYYPGSLCGVAVYGSELSAARVAAHYAALMAS